MAHRIGDRLPRKLVLTIWFWIAAGFALVSSLTALMAWHGWGLPLGAAIAAAVFVLLPWLAAPARETVEIDGEGIRRVEGDINEQVRWEDITRVRIVTTDSGPFQEDVFFLLDATNGKGCCVNHGAAERIGLLQALQARLPGVNDNEVIRAMGCTSNNSFVIWERPARRSE